MKKPVLLVILCLVTVLCLADKGLDGLWKKFYIEAKKHHFDRPVRIYEVDHDNTTLCFIYKKQVYFFMDGKITKSNHAKAFNTDRINRISYKKSKTGGAFLLWSNEKLVLTIHI